MSSPAGRLTPIVQIDGLEWVVLVPRLAGLPARELSQPIASLSVYRSALLGAIDLLFFGVP
jgi:toxin CcdB